jgi:hypothetical protein
VTGPILRSPRNQSSDSFSGSLSSGPPVRGSSVERRLSLDVSVAAALGHRAPPVRGPSVPVEDPKVIAERAARAAAPHVKKVLICLDCDEKHPVEGKGSPARRDVEFVMDHVGHRIICEKSWKN